MTFIINPFVFGGAVSEKWNSADKDADVTLSAGDTVATVIAANGMVRGVTGYSTGNHQFELNVSGPDAITMCGIAKASATLAAYPGSDSNGYGYYASDGNKYNGSSVAYGINYTTSDRIGVVWYATNGDIVFYKNGRFQGLAFSGVSGTLYPAWGPGSSGSGTRTATLSGQSLTYPVAGVTDWAGASTPSSVPCLNASDKDSDITTFAGDTYARLISSGSQLGGIRGVTGRASGSGVYQCEFIVFGDVHHMVGMAKSTAAITNYPGSDANGYGYYSALGTKYTNATPTAYGSGYALLTDVIGLKWDAAAGTMTYYINGSSQGTAFSSLSGTFYPMWGSASAGAGTRGVYLNTGQVPFIYPIGGATAWG